MVTELLPVWKTHMFNVRREVVLTVCNVNKNSSFPSQYVYGKKKKKKRNRYQNVHRDYL